MTENWKPIEGYEGIYSVSDLGRVRSEDREVCCGRGTYIKHGALLTPSQVQGVAIVSLSRDGCRRQISVAQLVARAFMPRYVPRVRVRHFDGDRLNNRVSNLYQGSLPRSPQTLHGSLDDVRDDCAATCRAVLVPVHEYEKFYQGRLQTHPDMYRR